MHERPVMTVAIPTMNGVRHIAEALRGILAQEGVGFDVLISDDRSDDETLEVARTVAGDGVRVVVNSERLGLAGNWNQCVARSRTPFVALVHQDDVLRPGHLAAHLAGFATDPTVGLVASGSRVIDANGHDVPATRIDRGGLGPTDRTFTPGAAVLPLALGNPLRCSAVSLRSAAFAEAGGFDPAYRYVVDWDFWLRLVRTWSLSWIARETVNVRWHDESETQRLTHGTTDLEESEHFVKRLLAGLDASSFPTRDLDARFRRGLGRAYLNRAHLACRSGEGRLAHHCLRVALRTWPRALGTIVADPRLAAQLAVVCAAPDLAGRWLGRVHRSRSIPPDRLNAVREDPPASHLH